ncbi:MAG: hypothetical protein KDI09_19725, partial [Halioglobus sp.]|nr:hypothetical protein [Halioglobus sp.]
ERRSVLTYIMVQEVFMCTARFVFGVVLGVALFHCAEADEFFIACPVDQLDSEVTTRLPEGWWSTPRKGDLIDTEIAAIGGQKTLVCNYRGVGASRTPVMREVPAGVAGCTAVAGGFNCSTSEAPATEGTAAIKHMATPVTQASVTAAVNTKIADTKAKSKACPDPAAFDLGLKYGSISKEPATGLYFFRLEGEVRNVGTANYTTRANQQMITLSELRSGQPARTLATEPFGNLAAGRSVVIRSDISRWKADGKAPPDFELRITYDPDIRLDGNNANHDCADGNNVRKLMGRDISHALALDDYEAAGSIIRR